MATVLDQDFLNLLADNGSNGVGLVRAVPGNPQTGGYQAVNVLQPPYNASLVAVGNGLGSNQGSLTLDPAAVTSTVVATGGATAVATVANNTAVSQSFSKTLSATVTDTQSATNTTTSATSVELSTELSGEVGFEGGVVNKVGFKIGAKFSSTKGESNTNTETTATAKTVSDTASITVPPGQTYALQLVVRQITATIPYHQFINITGGAGYVYSVNSVINNESSGEVVYSALKNGLPLYKDLNYNNLSSGGFTPPGSPGNSTGTQATYSLDGSLMVTQATETNVMFSDVTTPSELTTSPNAIATASPQALASPVGTAASLVGAATGGPPASADTTYYLPTAPGVTVGDYIQLDAAHTDVVGTGLGDEIYAGPGNDTIDTPDGDNLVYGGAGSDVIMAEGSGYNTLVGGSGDTHFILTSTGQGSSIQGGQGTNLIEAYAPDTEITPGAGDNQIMLSDASIGSVIEASSGNDTLTVTDNGAPVQYAQDGFDLIILMDGDTTYTAGKDIYWTDFFLDPNNSVNGLSTAALAELTKDGDFAATPPTITGTTAGETMTDKAAISPFQNASITDPDPGSLDDLTIRLTDQQGQDTDANGTLSGHGLTEVDTGTYTLAPASPAVLSAELDAINFIPTVGEVGVGQTATTGFTVTADEAGVTTSDSSTTVTTTGTDLVVQPPQGRHAVYGGAGNEVFVLPQAGKGFETIAGFTEDIGDVLDLRNALKATTWDGTATTLGDFLKVTDHGANTVLAIAGSGSGAATPIATLKGAGALSLSDLLGHGLLLT